MENDLNLFIVGVSILLMVGQEVRSSLERRSHRLHIEKLERMILAKSTGEYVAGERMVGAIPPAEPPPPPKPSLHEDVWTVPSRS